MDEPLVAVRIKDGIFVGNATAAHDDDFLMTNKISHVLNCAGGEVKDLFSSGGVQYLTFHWKDSAAIQNLATHSGVMFDAADNNIEQTMRFLDKGMQDGECVLVHDVHGTSRACALVAAYFVHKYGWRLDNALAFMQMAHQEMEIRPHWMRQLRAFAKRHEVDIDVFDPDCDDKRFSLDNDQWMLRNTLLNGLTANIQDGNALYKQCAKEHPALEMTAKAQQRPKRKRIVFCDTNQGTHVDSYSSTPVVQGSSKAHQDPMRMGTFPSYLGGGGIGAIIEGRRAVVESIVARRSPINTRRLESTVDVNAKGRQQLFRRTQSQPHHGTYAQGQEYGAGAVPSSARGIAGHQPVQRSNSLTNRQEQFAEQMQQRHATPTHQAPATTTPLRTSTTIQRHAPSITAPNTISHSLSNTTPVRNASPLARRTVPDSLNNSGTGHPAATSSTTPLRGSSLVTPIKQPLKSASGTVRSPFSVGSGGVTARKGSPLPRQAGSSLGSGPSSAGGSTTVRREIQSSGYGYGQISTGRTTTSRPASPAPQPHPSTVTSTLGRYGSSSGSSPFVQRGAASSRPQSPTQQRLNSSTVASSGYGAASSSGVVKRAMSPRPVTGGSSTITGGAGASSIQPTIRRANSPTTRTRIGSAASAYQPSMSAYSSGSTMGSPRPSSPMTRTGATSGVAPMGVRPASPARRPTTLADQYLAGPSATTGGTISRGLSSSLSQPTASSIARRNSPTPVMRRY